MKKILIVDYDQAALSTLHNLLSKEGFEVVLAADGKSGLDKFQSESPDLVVMEAMLSKIHGFELCERIAKDPLRKVPVFIMTGVYKDRVYRTEALRTYGASEYFEKPLNMAELLASIHAVLTVPDIRPVAGARPRVEAPLEPDALNPIKGVAVPANGNGGKPKEEPVPASAAPTPDSVISPDTLPGASPKQVPPRPAAERPRPEPRGEINPVAPMAASAPSAVKPAAKPAPAESFRVKPEPDLSALIGGIPGNGKQTHPAASVPLQKNTPPVIPVLVVKKAAPAEKPAEPKKEASGREEIDRLLKSTLADFGLDYDNAKTTKAPAVPPAAPEPKKPQPAHVPQSAKTPPVSAPAPKPPEKPKALEPAPVHPREPEKIKPAPPVKKAPEPVPSLHTSNTPPPAQALGTSKTKASPKPAPAPDPVPHRADKAAAAPVPTGQPRPAGRAAAPKPGEELGPRMFKDLYNPEKKKPVPKVLLAAGIIVAVAASAFLVFKPKGPKTPIEPSPSASLLEAAPVRNEPVTEPPAPKPEKKQAPAEVKPKAKTPVVPTGQDAFVPPPTTTTALKPPDGNAVKKSGDTGGTAAPAPTQSQPPAQDPQAKPAETQLSGASNVLGASESKTPETVATSSGTSSDPAPGGSPSAVPAAPAAPKAQMGDLIDLAAADEAPKVLRRVDPVYPAQAQRFGKEGAITVNALVSESGNVIDTGILKGLKDDMGLEKAAAAAVRKWKFQPARKDGVNVRVWQPVVIAFKANGGTSERPE